ncbi:glycosyltransferase family 87 protein [Deltaproteobacteria bacterium IMCC39524]|nr:glycosyltransferase family 87 protein [Deltaproteobacteria bacterium IMCC39524]
MSAERNPLVGALNRLTKPPWLTGALALLATLSIAVLAFHLATLPPIMGSEGNPQTGDFLAFYTGAATIAGGHGVALYDLDAQRTLQAALVGAKAANWQPYVNPPGLAILLSPFVSFGYHWAFFAFDAAGLFLFALAVRYLGSEIPALTRTSVAAWTTFLAVVAHQAVIHPLLGGQNTGITLSLLGLAYVAHRRDKRVYLGLVLGLLTFKPQYLLVLGPLMLLRGELLAVGIAGAVSIGHYALGAVFCGWDWPLRMLHTLQTYGPIEQASQGMNHFSLIATARHVLPEPFSAWVAVLGVGLVLAVMAVHLRTLDRSHPGFPVAWGMVVSGTMLVSPHLNYYDAGVLVLPVLLGLDHVIARYGVPGTVWRVALVALWASYNSWKLGPALGFQPLVLVLAVVFIGLVVILQRTIRSEPHPGGA